MNDREKVQSLLDKVTLGQINRRDFIATLGIGVLSVAGIKDALAQAEETALSQARTRAELGVRFDYVIVGGGTAGCIIAHRLVMAGKSVCMIEAGDDPRGNENTQLPHKWTALIGSDLDWKYESTPQPGAGDRVLGLPRGLALGGSSAINALMYMRPSAVEMNAWGSPDWAYDTFRPYMTRAENYGAAAVGAKGNAGPFHLETQGMVNPIAQQSLAAARELGFETGDLNDTLDTGASPLDIAVREGVRVDTGRAYLFPILDRPNIAVLTRTQALKLVFDGADCTGVVVRDEAGTRAISASEEVVLTAGAIGSPDLLLRSGVGDPTDLNSVGVDTVVANNQIGKGLQDHMNIRAAHFRAVEKLPPPRAIGGETQMLAALEDGNSERNVQVLFAQVPLATKAFGFLEGFSFLVGLMRPESQGSIRLNPADPTGRPLIDPGYLTVQKDVDALKRAYELASDLGNASAFDGLRTEQVDMIQGDQDAWIRANAGGYYHLTSSCRMGAAGDGAVGYDLRVHGAGRLRVADASIMPRISTVNTMATTIGIAERASDLILG